MIKKLLFKKNKYYGFTLVELIIVITILAILATIAFVSFSGYTGNSRDSNRLFSIKEISKSLTIQKELTGNFPVPDDIYATGGISNLNAHLFDVGIIGKGVSNYIKLGSIPLDPKSKNEYSYGLEKNNKYFQVAGTLENGEVLGYKLVNQTYAAGLPTAVVEGNYKGLIKFGNSPIYIANIPSLIYSRDGTYSLSDKKFVINKGSNVPYSVDGGSLGTGLSETEVLKEYYGTGTSIKTEEIDPNSITKDKVKDISISLGVSELEIAQVVDKKELIDYYASKPSSGGENSGGTPEDNGPKCEQDTYFYGGKSGVYNSTLKICECGENEMYAYNHNNITYFYGYDNINKKYLYSYYDGNYQTPIYESNTLKVIGKDGSWNSIYNIDNPGSYVYGKGACVPNSNLAISTTRETNKTPLYLTNTPNEGTCHNTPTDSQYFTFDDYSQAITKYDYINGPKDVVIPCTINGKKVKYLGSNSFVSIDNNYSYAYSSGGGLNSIKLPGTLEVVGYGAFGYNNINSEIVIPKSVRLLLDRFFTNQISSGGTPSLSCETGFLPRIITDEIGMYTTDNNNWINITAPGNCYSGS